MTNSKSLKFGMRGKKMTFSIGLQSFGLNYEPQGRDEFEFMKNTLTKAIMSLHNTECIDPVRATTTLPSGYVLFGRVKQISEV